MAISILITNRKIGKSRLYSEPNQKGKKMVVPAYQTLLANESGSAEEFRVTRDTIVTVFGVKTTGKYGENDEAPPNRSDAPYRARIRTDGRKGFRLELYEFGIGKRQNRSSLRGIGKFIRTHIQIHLGPARSGGCFLLTDRKAGRDRFRRAVHRLIREDKRNRVKNPGRLLVRVQNR